jgi:hypothetical protein
VKVLDLRGDGNVRWFTTPPIVVIDNDKIEHSKKYLEYLKKLPKEMELDEEEETPTNSEELQNGIDVEMEPPAIVGSDNALIDALKGIRYLF